MPPAVHEGALGPWGIRGARLMFPGDRIETADLVIDGGRIRAIGRLDTARAEVWVSGEGRLLTPGLIDLHTHGIERMPYDGPADGIRAALARLPSYGVTAVLPTLIPRPTEAGLRRLGECAEAVVGAPGAAVPGLHLEGPFMALPGAGCDRIPGDLGLLEELLSACRNRVAVMSLSPETEGVLPVIERLRERGIPVFLTHTAADVTRTQAAIDAGARHATHFYDVFPPPPVRDPGVRPAGAVEACLADDRVSVDFIADGAHVDPVVIRMALRAKGVSGVALITDSNIGAGLPPGVHPTPWGYPVRVEPGRGARVADPAHPLAGALAGSALTMDQGVRNLLGWMDRPETEIWAMATSTPARVAGLAGYGELRVGSRADLVLWNEDRTPARVWVEGVEQRVEVCP